VLALTAVVAAGAPLSLGARWDVTPPKLKIESHTLDNGLRVGLAQDTSRPVA
jgi:hypothetical protein